MPPPTDNISTGELGRRMDTLLEETRDFRKETNDRFAGLNTSFVPREVYDLAIAALTAKVASLEGNQQWLVRIIISTVVLAVLGGLFASTQLGAF